MSNAIPSVNPGGLSYHMGQHADLSFGLVGLAILRCSFRDLITHISNKVSGMLKLDKTFWIDDGHDFERQWVIRETVLSWFYGLSLSVDLTDDLL